MPRSTADELAPLLAGIFRAAGAPDAHAMVVADALVEAELCGHESHGLIRVTEYLGHIQQGVIVPDAVPRIVRDGGATLTVDGNWGFGQVVAGQATQWLIERTLEHGMAGVAVRACGHVGRAGSYAEMAARRGLVGLVFVNGGGAKPRLAPYGGRRPLFGTNPFAAAVPVPGADPIVVDFSTAAVASGKIRVRRDRGEPLPEGWILDSDGRPSTDPADYYAGGMLMPAAGHKGYGLSLLVELMAGCLTGAGSPGVSESGYKLGNGTFLQAFDVAAFADPGTFAALTQLLVDAVHATPPGEGHDEVLLPGEPEARAARTRQEGVEVSDSVWDALTTAARNLGVRD